MDINFEIHLGGFSKWRKDPSDISIREDYYNFIKEYIDLRHVSNFLSYHVVFKEDSPTTKLPVVFDASFLSTPRYSLNDLQMAGPIILRYRQHAFLVSADIEKMYGQVE